MPTSTRQNALFYTKFFGEFTAAQGAGRVHRPLHPNRNMQYGFAEGLLLFAAACCSTSQSASLTAPLFEGELGRSRAGASPEGQAVGGCTDSRQPCACFSPKIGLRAARLWAARKRFGVKMKNPEGGVGTAIVTCASVGLSADLSAASDGTSPDGQSVQKRAGRSASLLWL